MRKKEKLIVFDIDGTLWHPKLGLSTSSRLTVRRLLQAGHHLCICTGRTMNSIPDPVRSLPIHSWITSDGACIFSPVLQESLCIPPETVKALIRLTEKTDGAIALECEDRIYMNQKAACFYQTMSQSRGTNMDQEKIRYEDCIDEWNGWHPVFKICLPGFKDWPQTGEYFDQLDVLDAGGGIIELHPFGVNKGEALRKLRTALGFKKEDTICFADGRNDLAMAGECGLLAAMKEGHPDLLQAADLVCEKSMETAIEESARHLGLFSEVNDRKAMLPITGTDSLRKGEKQWNQA